MEITDGMGSWTREQFIDSAQSYVSLPRQLLIEGCALERYCVNDTGMLTQEVQALNHNMSNNYPWTS